MNKKIRWASLLIMVEIILTAIINWGSIFPIGSQSKQLLFFLSPLLFILLIFSASFLLTFVKNAQPFLKLVYEEKSFIQVFIHVFTTFLLFASLIFFMIKDTFLPEIASIYTPFAALGYVLFWEILVLFSFIKIGFRERPKYWIGLPALIAVNYFLWHTLVNVGRYLEPYYPQVYRDIYENVFTTYKWWQLFMPIREFGGFWAGGYVLTHFIEKIIGTAGTWYLYQLILLLPAFFLSWKVFRSKIFSYIVAICLVFGTHLYHAFQYASILTLYLLQTLFLLLLYFAYEFIRSEKKYSWHLFALIAVLIPTAFMTEGWLDFFSAAWAMSIILFFYFSKNKLPDKKRKTILLFVIFNIVAAIYIFVKFTYIGFTHQSGESKVVFSYGLEYFWRGVEDLISNYFMNLYATLTNFLPPAFTTSNALYQYEKLQDHAHYLLRGHYIYYWRYFAGALATLFYVYFITVLRKVFKHKAVSFLPLALFMTMIAVNSPTHTIVVHHPWKAMPVLGYYVEQGILGLSLAIAYGFHLWWKNAENRKIVLLAVSLVVLMIIYSSIRRPNYLWHMIETVGLDHQGPYPNPLAVTIIKIRNIFPGFLLY